MSFVKELEKLQSRKLQVLARLDKLEGQEFHTKERELELKEKELALSEEIDAITEDTEKLLKRIESHLENSDIFSTEGV